MKRRCIFALRLIEEAVNTQVDDLRSVMDNPLFKYQCKDSLIRFNRDCIPHPKSTNIFHVRNNLAFYMPIENLYYQKKYTTFPEV